ncbi:MAG: hypothetical protein M1365_06175 [Actinobacteria bacterium]|nr:hypothetical protein [Actinomycetota bacterium]
MKPIVLIVWPRHADFPICRYNLKRFRNYFQDIYIAFSEHHMGEDYSNFIRENVDAKFIDAVITQDGDWRNDAINQLLLVIPPCEHILFLEQDFLIRDESFFKTLFKDDHDFIYYRENDRKHPAFMLVKKELIDKTRKNFSACPPFYSQIIYVFPFS